MFDWLKKKVPSDNTPPVVDDGRVDMRIYCKGTNKYVVQWKYASDWNTVVDYSTKPLSYSYPMSYPNKVWPSIELAERAAREFADKYHDEWLERKKMGVVKELGRLP